jgi:biotin carboxyl carrier protein
MNLKIKINDRIYAVRVGSLSERPILVDVEGEIFEVYPEQDHLEPKPGNQQVGMSAPFDKDSAIKSAPTPGSLGNPKSREYNSEDQDDLPLKSVKAPIPGIITAVYVTVGSEVVVGQELLKLEAMKMNNSIRSNRTGFVREVHVSLGQAVKLNQVLLEFE